MNKKTAIIFLSVLVVGALIATGILLNITTGNESSNKLHTVPISVGENTYTVTVLSNYSAVPEVKYWEGGKGLMVNFRGDAENSFCNVTFPTDLLWGEIWVVDKYYVMNEGQYIQSTNGTHNSIYFTFNHTAYLKHFEIRATEAATTEVSE